MNECICSAPASWFPTINGKPTALCSRCYQILLRTELLIPTPGTEAMRQALLATLASTRCPDCGDVTQGACVACQEWGT
jgi:hypothetical protein